MIDSASNLRIPSSPRGVIQRRGSSSRDNLSGRDYFSGRGDFSGTGGFSSRGGSAYLFAHSADLFAHFHLPGVFQDFPGFYMPKSGLFAMIPNCRPL